ncbi:MAG: glycosyltransferase family 4 protein [FCB group bacterium]|nr:glycosyltransferase family 4 protein [FCB group bacterium]
MNDASLRILITDPHLHGGGQVRYVTNLAAEFVRAGHGVTIGCKPGSVLVDSAAAAHCAASERFALRGGLRPRAWWSDLREAMRVLREEKPDVVHVNGSQDHWLFGLADRMLGRPVCLVRTRHNTYPVRDSLSNRILNRDWTDYQIVVCDVVRKTLAAQSTFDAARMCTIHNGVDVEAFRPDGGMRESARREFGFDEQDIVLGIAARLVAAKGHEFLFRAVAQLQRELPSLRVLALGQGPLEASLKQLAGELGIGSRVVFAGFRNDMARCVQAYDICVQPSIDCDTSSFTMKEAMAAEKPVVASDYGGLTEIIDEGREGFIVPAGTVEPLAEALGRLASDANLRRQMGGAGRRRVLRDFSVEVFANRTLEAYRRAIEMHQRGRGA